MQDSDTGFLARLAHTYNGGQKDNTETIMSIPPLSHSRRRFLQAGAAGAALGSMANPLWAQSADPIKIGCLLDLSGPLQLFAKPKEQCLRLAVEELNEQGGLLGRPLELIVYDTQSNNQLYSQYAQQLALRDRVAVVHGAITSASRDFARPVLARAKTLYMMNMPNEGTEGACDRNLFTIGETPFQLLGKLIPYMMDTYGKRAYIMAADYIFGQLSAQWARRILEERGGEVVGYDLFPLEVDRFGPTIGKIQAARPDFIFNVFVGPAHGAFYGQWAAAGLNRQIAMSSHTIGNAGEQTRMAPEVLEGIVTTKNYFDELKTPASQVFQTRFRQRFGEVDMIGALGVADYQGMHLWAQAVRQAGSIDREKVVAALENGVAVDGPGGRVSVHPRTHYCTLDVSLARLENNRFRVLQTWQDVPPVADDDVQCNVLGMRL